MWWLLLILLVLFLLFVFENQISTDYTQNYHYSYRKKIYLHRSRGNKTVIIVWFFSIIGRFFLRKKGIFFVLHHLESFLPLYISPAMGNLMIHPIRDFSSTCRAYHHKIYHQRFDIMIVSGEE